jgi:hypothetical protein
VARKRAKTFITNQATTFISNQATTFISNQVFNDQNKAYDTQPNQRGNRRPGARNPKAEKRA